ncbi:MAG: bifunctional riboflavin kinase/FAD synthetase [Cyanothece sp. SIO1E1]|nr:bifunctional riboflavin kinase/FAD synthetase [Cyanothece sp. SIO1E1]
MWITSSLNTIRTPTTVALGNFDGLHQGHRRVIEPILRSATTAAAVVNADRFKQSLLCTPSLNSVAGYSSAYGWSPGSKRETTLPSTDVCSSQACVDSLSIYSTVVTFFPHPQEFFTGQSRTLLTPLDEKAGQLEVLGVDQLVLLPFNRTLAELSAQQFVEEILVQHLQATQISVGRDFRFGRARAGTVTDLQMIAAAYGIAVNIVPLETCHGQRISSSAIRQALQAGELLQANRLLDRPYHLTGRVIQGEQLGRQLGFPTANLKLCPEKFLPRQGVYGVKVYGVMPNPEAPLPGVMNIGQRPTVGGMSQTIEVHLLDWAGDLYGRTLSVTLEKFLRPEQKFSSLEVLKEQIRIDCEAAQISLMEGDRQNQS